MEQVRILARLVGFLMILSSAVVTVALLGTLYQLVSTPDSIVLVQEVEEFLSTQQPLVTGVTGEERTTFEIDPSVRVVLAVFIGGIVLVGISSVLHALIAGGLSLLRFARDEPGR